LGTKLNDEKTHKLTLEAIKVDGFCPVYEPGDKTIIKGPTIDLENSDAVCIHALFCIGPSLIALREGIAPSTLGLSTEDEDSGFFQCLDPGKPYTEGGTVLFKVSSS
jgi:uncharacterized repeat protein (TIGR04076 family)